MNSMGGEFKRARESRSLSLADVAHQLHIRETFLDAIEAERWNDVGDLVSLRGLIRTYARFLGLDGGALVQRFNQDYLPLLAPEPEPPKAPPFNMKSIAAVVVGVAAIAIIFVSLTQFVERVRLHRDHALASATAKPQPAMLSAAVKPASPRPVAEPSPVIIPTQSPSPTPSPAATPHPVTPHPATPSPAPAKPASKR